MFSSRGGLVRRVCTPDTKGMPGTGGAALEHLDCPICGRTFPTPEDLEEHGPAEHGETFLPAVKEQVEAEEAAEDG